MTIPDQSCRGSATAVSPVVGYGRIGERSAHTWHTWFVLRELLDHNAACNYDGSWTEYGSLVGLNSGGTGRALRGMSTMADVLSGVGVPGPAVALPRPARLV